MGGDTIFHSDRGSTYTSGRYRQTCTDLGLRQSAGRSGSCLDNAVAEKLLRDLETTGRRHFASGADARRAIFVWINYYNQHRLHSACGYRPPVEYKRSLTVKQRHAGSRLAA